MTKQKQASARSRKPAPAVTPETSALVPLGDPLREQFYNLPPDQCEILRGRLMARVVFGLAGMSNSHVQDVAQFIDIVENDRGCVTPTEAFFMRLLRGQYGPQGPLTPDDAADDLKEYRADFECTMNEAVKFNARYSRFLAQ